MTEKTNPFDKKLNERLWNTWKDQQSYIKLSRGFSSFELEDWDKEFFIPEIWDRMKYIQKIFLSFEEMCDQANLAIDLDARLKTILLPAIFNVNLPEPAVGQQYLDAVKVMIHSQYLDPIGRFLTKYETFKNTPSLDLIWKFLNEARFIFDVIVQTKNDPFTYHFKGFPSIKNLRTGEVIASEPQEIAITLKPFEVKINELVNVCQKSSDSIDLWVNKRRENKKELIQFAVNQSLVDSSYFQKQSNKWATFFQIGTILFTLAVIALGDRANLYIENQKLLKQIDKLELISNPKNIEAPLMVPKQIQ